MRLKIGLIIGLAVLPLSFASAAGGLNRMVGGEQSERQVYRWYGGPVADPATTAMLTVSGEGLSIRTLNGGAPPANHDIELLPGVHLVTVAGNFNAWQSLCFAAAAGGRYRVQDLGKRFAITNESDGADISTALPFSNDQQGMFAANTIQITSREGNFEFLIPGADHASAVTLPGPKPRKLYPGYGYSWPLDILRAEKLFAYPGSGHPLRWTGDFGLLVRDDQRVPLPGQHVPLIDEKKLPAGDLYTAVGSNLLWTSGKLYVVEPGGQAVALPLAGGTIPAGWSGPGAAIAKDLSEKRIKRITAARFFFSDAIKGGLVYEINGVDEAGDRIVLRSGSETPPAAE